MQTDRIFLRLGQNGALASDDMQWILLKNASPQKAKPTWRAVSFVHSTKSILLRCIREKGIETYPTAVLELDSMAPTFDEWKAALAALPA